MSCCSVNERPVNAGGKIPGSMLPAAENILILFLSLTVLASVGCFVHFHIDSCFTINKTRLNSV